MPAQFLISIIGLNRVNATKTCIEAVFRHSKDFDLVLTDNASTDGTSSYFDQLACANPNVTVFHETHNTGFIPPNNRAFDLAIKRSAKYFVALNNDTVPPARWLYKLGHVLDQDVNGALAGPMGGCNSLHINFHGYQGDRLEYIEGACLCVKVALVKQYSPLFSNFLDFIYGEDSDLSLRMRAQGHTIHLARFTLPHVRGETVQNQPEVKRRCDRAQEHNHQVLRHRWAAYLRTRRFDYEVLIKRRHALGDVLLTTPIIRAIKTDNPQAVIHVATDFPQVFDNNPLVWRAHSTHAASVPVAPAVTIDLDNAYESRPGRHIVQAYEEVAREQYGLLADVKLRTELYPSELDHSWARQLRNTVTEEGAKLCLIHPGPTFWPGKNWHEPKFAQLTTELTLNGWQVAAIGHGKLPEVITDCVDLTGHCFSITQLAAFMSTCQLFIGVDSFPMHAAQAMGLPTIGLFGCTNARYIMTLGSPHIAIEADPRIPCAGCRHRTSGFTFVECSADCINSIEVNQVLQAVERVMQ